MNVSELSDVEIERAMLWLYPPKDKIHSFKDKGLYTRYRHIYVAGRSIYQDLGNLSYLSDYNLTMPLAVEQGLDIALINGRASRGHSFLGNYLSSTNNRNSLRAISEVLIMIAMEKKG